MTTSSKQDAEMAKIVLEECNFTVDGDGEVVSVHGDFTRIVEYVGNNFVPEELCSDSDLEAWAEDNGFVKGE